ncbi:unnamed protein product [Ilex paraguariensis]|uniref:Uncharacterized protein n=1 Tax=Ilex paraguariensis TaxID=185542 RepID=A0ABC8SME4_9AQUA
MVMGGTVGDRWWEVGGNLGSAWEGKVRGIGVQGWGWGGCVCLWSCSVVWGAGDESMVESLLTCCTGFSGQSHLFKAFRTVSLSQCCAGSSASCSNSILHSLSSNLKSLPQVKKIRDPKQQIEMVGVPKEYLSGHAFHIVSFEFRHNIRGRSIPAEGTLDAAIFLAKKVIMLASSKCIARVQSKADKFIYNMIDVVREGAMR